MLRVGKVSKFQIQWSWGNPLPPDLEYIVKQCPIYTVSVELCQLPCGWSYGEAHKTWFANSSLWHSLHFGPRNKLTEWFLLFLIEKKCCDILFLCLWKIKSFWCMLSCKCVNWNRLTWQNKWLCNYWSTLFLDGSTQSTLFHFLCRSARFIFILHYLKLYVLSKGLRWGLFVHRSTTVHHLSLGPLDS